MFGTKKSGHLRQVTS